MVTFTHVLCPIDLSDPSIRALTYAAAVARVYRARLTVLHVVPTFDPMQVGSGVADPVKIVYPPSREDIIEALREAVARAGATDANVTLAAEVGDTCPTILDQVVALRADLLVLGTHGRGGFDHLLLGSVTEKVLRKASCPVLTVPPHAPATGPSQVKFARIVCPMDFSPASLQALGFALDLARQSQGSVTVLHVIEWLAEQEPRTSAHFNVAEYRRYLVDDAHERLRALVADAAPGARNVEDLVAIGRGHREVLRTASDRAADLVVMGAQGRGGIGLALFGSTTQEVVRGATCPVLTVRAAG